MNAKKISVIGAGAVGGEVARRIAEKNLAEYVSLVDIAPGLAKGKALDMSQSAPIEKFDTKIIGSDDYLDIKDSEIVVITAGLARKPGMSRDDLQAKNASIIQQIIDQVLRFAKTSSLILVTNPLDVMTYLAYRLSGFDAKRVIGMAPVLDSARMSAFISMETGVAVKDINSVVLGSHGDLMVPLPRYSTVKGKPLTEVLTGDKIKSIIERTQNGGAEIVSLLKTGSAFYAPSASVVHMVEAMLTNSKEAVLTCAYLEGQYGIKDTYLGVPAHLSSKGLEDIIEFELSPEELATLQKSAEAVKEGIKKLNL